MKTYQELLDKYYKGLLNEEEKANFFVLISKSAIDREVKTIIAKELYDDNLILDKNLSFQVQRITETVKTKLEAYVQLNEIDSDRASENVWKKYRWLLKAAAILLISIGIWWFSIKKPVNESDLYGNISEVLPGKKTANLILPDGSTINLLSEGGSENCIHEIIIDDRIRYDNGTEVIDFQNEDIQQSSEIGMYTLSTPKGGEYGITLADGSKVRLNADSRLIYPKCFSDRERRVEVIGEAFFEIVKKEYNGKHVPFIITAKDQTVEVLGTSFNMNAYPENRGVTTTLIHGKVAVKSNSNSQSHVLFPGQESIVDQENSIKVVDANIDESIAWTRGEFMFSNRSLHFILHAISRWYNIDIDYNALPDTKFTGSLPRNKPLDEILHILEKTGNINFNIKNGKLTTTKL